MSLDDYFEHRPAWERPIFEAVHPRIARAYEGSGSRSAYFIDLRDPADLDDDVRDWLTESYLSSPV